MKYVKTVPSTNPDQKFDLVEIEKEEYIAECLIELIEQGIDEDRHFFGWQDLDEQDLRKMLEDETSFDKMLQYAKDGIKEQLMEALEDLEEARGKTQLMKDNARKYIKMAAECYSGHMLTKSCLKKMTMTLAEGSVSPAIVWEIIDKEHDLPD